MSLSNEGRYNGVAMSFHWVIALLILTNMLLGYWFGWLEDNALQPGSPTPAGFEAFLRTWPRIELVNVHKTIGMSILILSVLRLGWRLMNPPPPLQADLKPWERMLAHVVHWSLYAFMIGMPLVGWAMVSASARYHVNPINLFGLQVPAFPFVPTTPHNAARKVLGDLHTDWLPWLFWVLFALHVLGALKHQFLDKDGELGRMIPFLRRPGLA